MIVINDFGTDLFWYAAVAYGPHTSHTFHNTGNARFFRYFYLMYGDCVSEFRDVEDLSYLPTITLDTAKTESLEEWDYRNQIVDIGREAKFGTSLDKWITTKTSDQPMGCYIFLPTPIDKDLDIQILKQGFHTITASGKPHYVVVLEGPISVKPSTQIQTTQWFKIDTGKTIEVLLEERHQIAVIKEK